MYTRGPLCAVILQHKQGEKAQWQFNHFGDAQLKLVAAACSVPELGTYGIFWFSKKSKVVISFKPVPYVTYFSTGPIQKAYPQAI